MSCPQCRKTVSATDGNCSSCQLSSVLAVRLVIYLEVTGAVIKVVCFDEPLSSIFGATVAKFVANDDQRKEFVSLLDTNVDSSLAIHLRVENRSFESPEGMVTFLQYTGRAPAFFLAD
jgi:hypothetical protein